MLVALLTEVRLAAAEERCDVTAKKTFECNVLVPVCVASGWEILVAIQAVDAFPRLLRLGLVVCCRAFQLTGVARFLAIAVGICVKKLKSSQYQKSSMYVQAYHELPLG